MTDADPITYIIYDGECPFCTAYVKMTRLKQAAGEVQLLNLREPHPVVDEVAALGFDFDEGMAMKRGDAIYHGDEVVYQLALMTSPSGLFNRFNAWLFRHPKTTRALYPWMRRGRNLALRLLGRKSWKESLKAAE